MPSDGIPLSELPPIDDGLKKSRVPQAVEVALNGKGTLQDMLAALRQDPDGVQVSLGKKPVCVVKSDAQQWVTNFGA